tara:strand:- start:166 stop:360 length:195 start_codon:yes stop_codon:yes gene_type:complete
VVVDGWLLVIKKFYMKKFLVIIFVLVLLVFLGQAYESASCKDRVEKLKLTGIEAENEYNRCKSF